MKKIYSLIALAATSFTFAQSVEIFTNSGNANGEFANWTLQNNVTSQAIVQSAGNGYLLLEAGNPGDIIITTNYSINNYSNLKLNYQIATYGSGNNNSATVSISYDNGVTYTQTFTSQTPTSSTYIDATEISLVPTSATVKIKFSNSATTGKGVRFKSIVLTGETAQVSTPTLTTNVATLTNLNYIASNGPSTSQAFNLSGTDLNNTNVIVTAPTNFEVSSDNTTFAETATLTAFNGTSTPINVRLKSGLTVNTYSGNISINGGGISTAITVAVSGEVTAAPIPAELTTSVNSITALNYTETEGPSTSQAFNLSGNHLNNTDVVVTAPTNFEVSNDNTTFGATATLTAFNGTATPINVRLKSGLAVNTYSGNISINGGGITTPINVAVSGEVIAPTASVKDNNIEGLKVYPNPVSDVVYITSNEIGAKEVKIFNMLGKKVLEVTTEESINVSNLNTGVYIMNITQDGKNASRKLVIK